MSKNALGESAGGETNTKCSICLTRGASWAICQALTIHFLRLLSGTPRLPLTKYPTSVR